MSTPCRSWVGPTSETLKGPIGATPRLTNVKLWLQSTFTFLADHKGGIVVSASALSSPLSQ